MMKKRILLFLMVLLLISGGCSRKAEEEITEEEPVEEEVIEQPVEEEIEEDPHTSPYDLDALSTLWQENKKINSDYVGEIFFESGLVDQPFVQGASNDTYLRKDWITGEYLSCGSIFMDFRNTLNDQNVIIYGHYVYLSKDPSGEKVFTPLRFLTDEENYEENKTFYLFLGDELRQYDICVVYYCQLISNNTDTDPKTRYYYTEYDEDYFNSYKEAVKKKAFYETGTDFTYEDKLVTLQTCVENRDDLREIIIAKLVDSWEVNSEE